MRQISQAELGLLNEELKTLVGAQLQEVVTSEETLQLGFFMSGKTHWVYISMKPTLPVILLLSKQSLVSKKTKPLGLFLKSHAENKRLLKSEIQGDLGRVITLFLVDKKEESVEIEIRLFMHGQNILVKSNGKKISWNKPKELKQAAKNNQEENYIQKESPLKENYQKEICRSLEDLRQEYFAQPAQKSKSVELLNPEEALKKQIAVKERALLKMQADIEEKKHFRYQELGEALKVMKIKDLPPELLPLIKKEYSLTQNREYCFQKAKELKEKILRAEERKKILLQEILKLKEQLEAQDFSPLAPHNIASLKNTNKNQNKNKKKSGNAKTRKLVLNERLEVLVGKSAADNLQLLRSAQGWDIWMHLRNYPGAYAIIKRAKGLAMDEKNLISAGQFLLRESVAPRRELREGDKVEIQYAECRFVRPIKGDRLGRVTVQNEKVLTILYRKNF